VAAVFVGRRVHDRQRDPIVIKLSERRPVVLSNKEEQLYRVAFSSIDKREFLRLVSLARLVDCSPGEVILEKGQHISEAIVVIAGDIEAVLGSNTRAYPDHVYPYPACLKKFVHS
jgi:hypothetical protein